MCTMNCRSASRGAWQGHTHSIQNYYKKMVEIFCMIPFASSRQWSTEVKGEEFSTASKLYHIELLSGVVDWHDYLHPSLASTGLSSTGLSSTGLSSTGLSSTGLSSTGLSSTGLSSTGLSSTGLSSTGLSSTGLSSTGLS